MREQEAELSLILIQRQRSFHLTGPEAVISNVHIVKYCFSPLSCLIKFSGEANGPWGMVKLRQRMRSTSLFFFLNKYILYWIRLQFDFEQNNLFSNKERPNYEFRLKEKKNQSLPFFITICFMAIMIHEGKLYNHFKSII